MDVRATMTIGRNIGEDPMDALAWHEFQHHARKLFANPATTTTVFDNGEWAGIPEQCAHIAGDVELDEWGLFSFIEELAGLARVFGQEAIAYYALGDTHWTLVYQDGHYEQGWEVV